MTWRIRDRSTFGDLRNRGCRRHRGAIGVTWLAGDGGPARIGYAIGRSVGTAVVRNRLRRRLRAIMGALSVEGLVMEGAYLVTVRPAAAALTFAQLTDEVRAAMQALPRPAGARRETT